MAIERRRLITAAGGTLLLSLAPWQIASGAKIIDVRMWPADEYSRVTIESDAPLTFNRFVLRTGSPLRFVIDITGLTLTERVRRLIAAVRPDDPYIAAMRIAQFRPGVLRLVMDLKTEVNPKVFRLDPVSNYRYRLVFDIYPANPRDVIAETLAGLENDAPEENLDPLGTRIISLLESPSTGASEETAPVTPATPEADLPKEPAETTTKAPRKADTVPKATEGKASRQAERKNNNKNSGVITVVVDPGHGGEDPGAIGLKKTMEKTVVLQIARRLAALINAERGMKAVLTRNSDYFVSLGDRIEIARKKKAHLLVSIHADAWVKRSSRGSSVFALSEKGATSSTARWLAERQNDSDRIGGVSGSATTDLQVNSILVDMSKNWAIPYSLKLGSAVLRELGGINRLHRDKVEQAGFVVLKGQGIPSILVETAFISNPTEEMLLRKSSHQQAIARAILNGIKKQIKADPSLLRQR